MSVKSALKLCSTKKLGVYFCRECGTCHYSHHTDAPGSEMIQELFLMRPTFTERSKRKCAAELTPAVASREAAGVKSMIYGRRNFPLRKTQEKRLRK